MAPQLPTISLVIATYNWPQALRRCLQSVAGQRELPLEVIIADDGSENETRELIEKMQPDFPVPLRHIWQPDEGFQLSRIRNRANAAARGEYIIQIDGDLILHPDFVRDHRQAARPGRFICGSRVILGVEKSKKLIEFGNRPIRPWEHGIRNRINALHLPLLSRLLNSVVKTRDATHIRGCNMSYYKQDFVAVNGYNEAYQGWGREDSDLVIRFYLSGLNRSWFKMSGVTYHLWHKEADRRHLEENDALLQATILQKRSRCEIGIDQYLCDS